MKKISFNMIIRQGIPNELPLKYIFDNKLSHAPKRVNILDKNEEKLAVRNALRYFPAEWHEVLAGEFLAELRTYGRIYMYRFKPSYKMYARPVKEYPSKSIHAAAIMMMIQNNLDPAVAQFPDELITYGGNGSVFQNWAQYLLTMKYLSEMTDTQTLHIYSGHPMGLFPSSNFAPRVVVSNGMMIPNYSKPEDLEKFSALGVTQYGQMTAGSYMYIGPQGIVHGTTITVINAFRKHLKEGDSIAGKVFLTSGLGGMSGAQAKAGNIAGCITVCAEVNPMAADKRFNQKWVDVLINGDLDKLVHIVQNAIQERRIISIGFVGNIVEVWERFYSDKISVSIGSDQTSLHNPYFGGYYPVGLSFEDSNALMAANPQLFKQKVQESLIRHVQAINLHVCKGTYFFDYGNAFLLEAKRAGAAVVAANGIDFKYSSYVQDILGPMCFDFGFGPFRWVVTSGSDADLRITDKIALKVMTELHKDSSDEIAQQIEDNIKWIQEAEHNNLVVGSKARILYADSLGRMKIAEHFNRAVAEGIISAPVVIGRDHHDVSGTDSPYRETSNIYDGSQFTADMAIHNVIGDSFRGATWVSIHNGGGVGWGEVINGGFGLLLDGTRGCYEKLKQMLFFDVNNGIARRSWARNKGAQKAIETELNRTPNMKITHAVSVDDYIVENLFN